MRMVRFEDESGGFAVDLHPLITVISGLPPHVRERLVNSLAALPSGSDPGGRGEVEVHGVYLDLNRESLELLELDQDLDVVLRAADLPGGEQMADLVADDEDSSTVPDELRDAQAEADAGDRACEDAERLVETLRAQLGAVLAERDELTDDLERVRAGLDSFAVAGLNVARDELAEIERRLAETGDAADGDEDSDVHDGDPAAALAAERDRIESRLSFLIEESDRLKRLARSLGSIDPSAVESAFRAMTALAGLDAVVNVDDVPAEDDLDAADLLDDEPELELHADEPELDDAAPVLDDADEVDETDAFFGSDDSHDHDSRDDDSHDDDSRDDDSRDDDSHDSGELAGPTPEAAQLISLWEDLLDREDDLAERLSRPDPALVARDAARDALVAADEAMRAPRLDPALVEELESTHDEIFELSGRTSKLAAIRSKRRLEALHERHRQLLEELGFASWSAYIMGIASAPTDSAAVDAYERAAADLEDAEERLALSRAGGPRRDPEADEVAEMRALLRRRTEDLLGAPCPDDPIVALTEWRPAPEPAPTTDAFDALDALGTNDAPDAPDTTDLPDTTDSPDTNGRARELVGDGFTNDDGAHDEPQPTSPGTAAEVEAAAIELWDALAATGAQMPDDVTDPIEIHSLAAGWLDAMGALPERIAEVLAERDDVEAEIAQLAVEFDALPSGAPPSVGRHGARTAAAAWDGATPPSEAEVEAARRRVAEIEARAVAHQKASEEFERIEERQAESRAQARELNAQLAEREPQLAALRERRVVARNRLRRAEAARDADRQARDEQRARRAAEATRDGAATAEAVEWYVLARLAQQRSVSFVGSVPLVIDDAFANWPVDALGEVFSRLERMGDVIQIVFLTESAEVGDWARSLGSDRALVLDMRVSAG